MMPAHIIENQIMDLPENLNLALAELTPVVYLIDYNKEPSHYH
jgi:hypothetical protein